MAEIDIRYSHGYKLLGFLMRYDWRSVLDDEASRFAELLVVTTQQQLEAALDAVMECN